MMTYRTVLKDAQKQCLQHGISEQVPLLLLLELSQLEAHDLYAEYEEEIDSNVLAQFEVGVARLLKQEPLAHILGYEYFYGYKFKINANVLIPRPETEELVANILAVYDEYFGGQEVQVIDVGCGSGAISISLALEESKMHVVASDISEGAIEVARENARSLQADVSFMVGDMLQPFIDKKMNVDFLISNPPYIPQSELMEKSVIDFEPHVALFGGDDGLYFYRKIFEQAHKLLNEKSILAFEIGYDQKERLSALASQYFPDASIEVLKDLSGKDRMLFIYNNLRKKVN